MRLVASNSSPSNSQPYIRAAPARDLVCRRRDVRDRRLIQHHFLSEPPGRIDDRTWRAVPTMTPLSSGSPFQRVATNDLACLRVMCGGKGGTSGSVLNSTTTGRSVANACSQADATWSGLSTYMPLSPINSANLWYGTFGMRCDALNFGSPSMTRCSQVTWFRSSLLKTPQIQRGFFHSRQYFATVISSAMLFICIAPSPTSALTGRSGWYHLGEFAFGA